MRKNTRVQARRQPPKDGLKRDKDGQVEAVQLEAFPAPVPPSLKAAAAAAQGQTTLFPTIE